LVVRVLVLLVLMWSRPPSFGQQPEKVLVAMRADLPWLKNLQAGSKR